MQEGMQEGKDVEGGRRDAGGCRDGGKEKAGDRRGAGGGERMCEMVSGNSAHQSMAPVECLSPVACLSAFWGTPLHPLLVH